MVSLVNRKLIQPFGDLEIFSFHGISRLNWIGRVNTMDTKSKVSQVHINNSQGSQLRRRQKITECGTAYKRILIEVKLARQAMRVKRNIEARSCKNCFSGKSISITYSERAFVALGIQCRNKYVGPS